MGKLDAKVRQAILKIAKYVEETSGNTKKMVQLLHDMRAELIHLIETRLDLLTLSAPGRTRDPGNGDEEEGR